jgi:V/A-type H+/Na+-transporting ATPase subunit I
LTNYGFLPEPIRNAMLWIRTSAPADPAKFAVYHEWLSGLSMFPASFTPMDAGESQMQHVQFFCFCLAVVHLSIAHVWNIIVRLRRKDSTFMAQVGWLLCCWCMFALANYMVLGMNLPDFVLPMFITAAVILVLFSVPPKRLKQEWISIPMLVLNIVNSFTDVISYIRLFAVGMSGAAIADAFNGMLSPLFGSFVGIAGAAFVLLFVHALNIALAVMGVAVHAVRLNTLEFSNGLDLQWSGFAYAPFAKSKN